MLPPAAPTMPPASLRLSDDVADEVMLEPESKVQFSILPVKRVAVIPPASPLPIPEALIVPLTVQFLMTGS